MAARICCPGENAGRRGRDGGRAAAPRNLAGLPPSPTLPRHPAAPGSGDASERCGPRLLRRARPRRARPGGIPARRAARGQGRAHLRRLPRPRRLARPRHRRAGRESRDRGRGGVRRRGKGAGGGAREGQRRVRDAGREGQGGVEGGGEEGGGEVRQAQRAGIERRDRQLRHRGRVSLQAVGRGDRREPDGGLQRPPRRRGRAQGRRAVVGRRRLLGVRAAGVRRQPGVRRGKVGRARAGKERRAGAGTVRRKSEQLAPGNDRVADDRGPAEGAEARGDEAGGQGARAVQDGGVFGVGRVFVLDRGRVRRGRGRDGGAGDGLESVKLGMRTRTRSRTRRTGRRARTERKVVVSSRIRVQAKRPRIRPPLPPCVPIPEHITRTGPQARPAATPSAPSWPRRRAPRRLPVPRAAQARRPRPPPCPFPAPACPSSGDPCGTARACAGWRAPRRGPGPGRCSLWPRSATCGSGRSRPGGAGRAAAAAAGSGR